MAMQNDSPKWIHSEITLAPDSYDIKMRVGIRAHEGWIKVLDLTHDRMGDGLPTRRQILENIQYNTTLQLAELTLEET